MNDNSSAMRPESKGEKETAFYDSSGVKKELHFLLKREKSKTHDFKWGLYWQAAGEGRKTGI